MTLQVANEHVHVQKLVSVVKMATVLQEYTSEERSSAVCFLWAKGLNAKDIHKEICPVYGGKCFSCKVVHSLVEKFSQGRSKVADDVRPGAEVAETTVCGFRRTGKAMGQVYLIRWRICREINVFPDSHVRCFTFYFHL
jgi:hypothetical protein